MTLTIIGGLALALIAIAVLRSIPRWIDELTEKQLERQFPGHSAEKARIGGEEGVGGIIHLGNGDN